MTFIQRIEGQSCGCEAGSHQTSLISIDEALARIERAARPVARAENIVLADAVGRVLDFPVRSLGMVPPFDNAAVDGYAINTACLTGDGPWQFPVEDRVAAGQNRSANLSEKAAIQIFTGAPIPDGADAVVMQEDVQRNGNLVTLCLKPASGAHIRMAGEDMVKGKIIVPAGQCLTVRDIAACAAAGHARVFVRRRVRVSLLVTGDEVRQSGQERGPAGIWDVNTPMLRAAITSPAIEICGVCVAADTRNDLRIQLTELAEKSDLVVTTGGISVGEEDHVKPALRDIGGEINFSGVALKPGKPVSFGRIGTTCWLGLPGNPLSAFVTWQLFGSALCHALSGNMIVRSKRRHAVLSRTLQHKPGRCELRPARLSGFDGTGREVVEFADTTHSGRVAQLPAMDGILFIPSDAKTLPAGALVEFQPF